MRKHMKNDSGYVLIGVIATFMVLSILSLTMISISAASFKTSASERDNQSAFYIAEAGLNLAETKLKTVLEEAYDLAETQGDFDSLIPTGFEDSYGHENEFENPSAFADTKVSQSETDPYEYHIESLGQIDGESRTLTKTLQVQWQDKYQFIEQGQSGTAPPFAVFTSGNFSMSNGKIIGDIGTTSDSPNSINFPSGGPSFNGDIFIPNGDEQIVDNRISGIKPDLKEMPSDYTFPTLPDFPNIPPENINFEYPDDLYIEKVGENGGEYLIKDNRLLVNDWFLNSRTLLLDKNYYFTEILINAYRKLTLDVGNEDRHIVVDHLNLINGDIFIEGNGSLTIYVKDKITMGSGSQLNKLNPGDSLQKKVGQVNIFYAGANKPSLGDDVKINSSIYVKTADIHLGSSVVITGNVFSGGQEIVMTGDFENISQVFFAPNAKITVKASGKLKGRVITRDFHMEGGATIEFTDELDIAAGPISPSALGIQSPGEGGGDLPGGGGLIKVPIEGSELSFTAGSMNEK